MEKPQIMEWEKKIVSPAEVMEKITPGANIFLGTGAAEPRTLVRHLMDSDAVNLQDLEFTQIVSLGDAITLRDLQSQKFRLKTFFSGWVAGEAFTQGRVDLIPSRFAKIPDLIESGRISIDIAFIQITPPDQTGFCSLGVAVDVAQLAMDQARLVVGEINPMTPRTFGDTFVPISNFDLLVHSTEEPICFPRWKKDKNFEQVAANLASVIEDGSCLGFSIGPLYETLCGHLSTKRNLG
ncbi:MAG: GNAT family N-acetyltransferase, partial [Thermodesulfobacteriota bacterium]|nr:GNAT family N-acetyltransferase [Thermodesulfobacteriota bacterium]